MLLDAALFNGSNFSLPPVHVGHSTVPKYLYIPQSGLMLLVFFQEIAIEHEEGPNQEVNLGVLTKTQSWSVFKNASIARHSKI